MYNINSQPTQSNGDEAMIRIITVLFATTFFASAAYAEKVFCQADAELEFFGWDVSNASEPMQVQIASVVIIPHQTDKNKILKQTTSAPFSPTQVICIQQEVNK